MQTKQNDFSGEIIYIGIDVHYRRWKVAILWREQILRVFSQDAKASILVNYLKKYYPGATYECGYEAGFCGFYICRQLEQQGIKCKVLHAADIPTTDKQRRQKTDARDCRKIAVCLLNPLNKGIDVPSEQLQKDRNVCRLRTKISRDCTRVRNRIKSLIYFMGWPIEMPKSHWSYRFIEQLRDWADEQDHTTLKLLLEEYKALRKMKAKVLKALRELSKSPKYKDQVSLLLSVPGMGLVHSMNFLLEIGDIKRFKTLDELCSMIGLIPNTNASGDKAGVGRMTKRGKKEIKNSIIEAAWIAIRYDKDLKRAFDQYAQRMKKNQAIVRIAKKLLNRIRAVMIEKRQYELA